MFRKLLKWEFKSDILKLCLLFTRALKESITTLFWDLSEIFFKQESMERSSIILLQCGGKGKMTGGRDPVSQVHG